MYGANQEIVISFDNTYASSLTLSTARAFTKTTISLFNNQNKSKNEFRTT
jgi:hypothetical protein